MKLSSPHVLVQRISMSYIPLLCSFLLCFLQLTTAYGQDWSKFYNNISIDRYLSENEELGAPRIGEERVVLMGNSITEMWPKIRPAFFEQWGYICRGVSGQTTPQMLIRFRTDVINLKPKVVVILAGINDIAQNTGYIPIKLIAENTMSMAELARQHKIEVIICSVLPAIDFPWRIGLKPADKVIALNALLKTYAVDNDFTYLDYHSFMKDEENGLKVPDYTSRDDLVHPNENGYKVMESLLVPAVEKLLTHP